MGEMGIIGPVFACLWDGRTKYRVMKETQMMGPYRTINMPLMDTIIDGGIS
jgi:hypothetical protein